MDEKTIRDIIRAWRAEAEKLYDTATRNHVGALMHEAIAINGCADTLERALNADIEAKDEERS